MDGQIGVRFSERVRARACACMQKVRGSDTDKQAGRLEESRRDKQ